MQGRTALSQLRAGPSRSLNGNKMLPTRGHTRRGRGTPQVPGLLSKGQLLHGDLGSSRLQKPAGVGTPPLERTTRGASCATEVPALSLQGAPRTALHLHSQEAARAWPGRHFWAPNTQRRAQSRIRRCGFPSQQAPRRSRASAFRCPHPLQGAGGGGGVLC